MARVEPGLTAGLAEEAARRHVRWNGPLWDLVVAGPARTLAAGLTPSRRTEALLESYLRLAAEGIGLGHLVPTAAIGSQNFLTLAWTDLVPRLLPAAAAGRQADLLAASWNLGENLATGPPWLDRLVRRRAADLSDLEDLPALLAAVGADIDAPPAEALGRRKGRLVWLDLAAGDWRFLPGAVHFIRPAVLCVHDRDRSPVSGGPAHALAVHLVDPRPEVLGPSPCRDEPAATGKGAARFAAAAGAGPGLTGVRATAANRWRAAASLETSQFIVAIYPS